MHVHVARARAAPPELSPAAGPAPAFVGIDVAPAHLEVALRPADTVIRVANDPTGHAALLVHLAARPVALVAVEATGGYEQGGVAALTAAAVPVAVLNPRQVRDF